MKVSISFFIFILFFSCKKKHDGISDCICIAKEGADSMITITNPVFDFKDNQGIINYNCAEVEIAIASVTDSAGNESCKNLIDIKCISNQSYSLKLANKLNYTSAKFKEINSSDESAKHFLINEFKENSQQIFEVNINKNKEIVAIKNLRNNN